MLKKVIGAKGIFLLAGVIVMVSLSGCGNDQTEQDSAGTIIYEEEASENQETEHSEQTGTENKSDSTETKATTKEETPGTAQSETKETTTQNEVASQSQTENTSITLTDKEKTFLAQICNELADFNSGTTMDEKFWRDFLFNSYTGALSENAATEQVYREDLGFEETVVKVSLQEAQERVKLVFGVDLPDYQYTFSECTADKENNTNTIVKYTIDFMGESNVGTVTLSISPENNANGFVICSKKTEFLK